MNAATLTLRGLSVGYRGRWARSSFTLGAVDAEIAPGRLVCVLGPNGSGKSTLLRTIAGFQPPLAGSVFFEGRPAGELSANERARFVSVVLTERVDSGMLNAQDLVSLGRYPYTAWTGGLTREDRRVIDWALDTVGALDLARRAVISLSDGERQKIMIARALAQEPRLIVLDEPTAFLDLPRKVEVMILLGNLARERGCSVLLSTHELEIAQALADRLWLIRPGAQNAQSTLTTGAPEDLVLSGEFERIFQAPDVRFDRDLGRFLFGKRPDRQAVVRGTGLSRHWTERALGRVGIEALDHASDSGKKGVLPVITVQTRKGGYLWTLTYGGATRGFNSISDLIAALDVVEGSH